MEVLCSLLRELDQECILEEDGLVVISPTGTRLEFYEEMDELTMYFGCWHRHYNDGADPCLVEDLQYLFGNIHCVMSAWCSERWVCSTLSPPEESRHMAYPGVTRLELRFWDSRLDRELLL